MTACVPPPPPKLPDAPQVPLQQKMAWILRLEDQRLLRFDLPAPPPPPPPPVKGKKPAPAAPPPPPPSLARPGGARVVTATRACAAARRSPSGASGSKAGVPLLVAALPDTDPTCAAMAAFALGLIGDAIGRAGAHAAPDRHRLPRVRGRAAEALGLIGATGGRGGDRADGRGVRDERAVGALQPDDEAEPAAPEAEAFKLGLFALVRLKALRPDGRGGARRRRQPVTTWWPVAYALQRVEDPRRRARAPAAARLERTLHARRSRREGSARSRTPPPSSRSSPLLEPAAKAGLELTVAAIRALAQLGAIDAAAPPLAPRRHAVGASEHPARSGGGTRHAAGRRRAADGPGPVDRRVARDARRRAARRGGDRPGELRRWCCGHGARSPLAGSGGARRHARHAPRRARGRPRCARCCRTRTSA